MTTAEPSSDPDLEALDAFLMSDDAPPECMMLSDLDGFLTGIAVGPELIKPSEWLPVIWGGEEPAFDDAGQEQTIVGAIMRRYNEILSEIEAARVVPIFWQTPERIMIAGDWAEGFAIAIGMRAEAWKPLIRSKRHSPFLLPILGLCSDDTGASALGLDPEADENLAREAPGLIPDCVVEIARYWRSRPTSRSNAKPGRNDPCPCGSGNKFKKCCGQAA